VTSRIPHFLDNRLTDGSEVVSLMHRQRFTHREDYWYSFLLEAESNPRAIARLEGLCKSEKIKQLIGNRIRDLPA
jgi:hypothetical protein